MKILKTRLPLLALFVVIVLCSHPALAQSDNQAAAEPVSLTEEQGRYPLGKFVEILEDPTGELTIEDVSSPAFDEKFIPSQTDSPNYGYTDSAYWVRVKIQNNTVRTDHWLLEIVFPNTQYVDLYTPATGNDGFTVKHSGVLRPVTSRDIFYPRIIFHLIVLAQHQDVIYLRFKSGASMTLPLILWSHDAFINSSLRREGLMLIFYGILVGLLLYNIFLLVSLREASYLYLVIFLTAMIINLLAFDGYIDIYLLPNLYYLKPYYHPLVFCFTFGALVLFGDAILGLRSRLPTIHWSLFFVLAGWGILVSLIFISEYYVYAEWISIWATVSSLSLTIAGVAVWIKGYSSVRFFMIACSGLLAAQFVFYLVRLGVVSSNFLTENSFRMGLVWMAVLWSIALADRINILQSDILNANRNLQNSEQRLSQILDGLPLGVVLYSNDLKPRYANPRSIEILRDRERGIEPDPESGRNLLEAMSYYNIKRAGTSEDYPLENFPTFSALNGLRASADDIEMDRGDRRIPLELWASPVKDDRGKVDSAVLVFQDITERKVAEAELAEYRAELEELVKERTAELNTSNQELRQRLDWLAAVNAVNQLVARSADFAEIFEKIIDIINNLFETSDSFIAEWNAPDRQVKILAHSCRKDSWRSLIGSVTAFPVSILSPADGENGSITYVSRPPLEALDGPLGAHIRSSELHGIAFAPLQLRDQTLGYLGLELCQEGRTLTSEETNLLSIFSTDIAQLIEDVHLLEQAKSAAAQEERSRLARDLHDSVTQDLFSATLVAEVLPQIWHRDPEKGQQSLDKLRRLTRGALAEMRTLLLELRPAAIVKTPLGELLAQLTEAITSRSALPFHLFFEKIPPIPDDVQIAFYRIAQEALNNVVKHAQAKQVTVTLSALPLAADGGDDVEYETRLEIQDDGVGFFATVGKPGHLGLSIMRERAAAIGAELTLESEPGHGACVSLAWYNGSRLDHKE